ncbi:MAG: T9SS type A sorting domain-containing protein, partial [bacterium]
LDLEIDDARASQRSVLAGLLGEYIGVTAWNGVPTPVWTDIRNGHQDVFAGHLRDDVSVLVQRFEATANRGVVHLEWDIVSDETVAGFNVYRRKGRRGFERVINRDGLIPGTDRSFDDTDFEPGESYSYTLGTVMADGKEFRSPAVAVETIQCEFALGCNYPNPFNPATTITYIIPRSDYVSLRIYDIQGHLIDILVSGHGKAGEHSVSWNGTDANGSAVMSGVYIVRLRSGGRAQTGKILLLK